MLKLSERVPSNVVTSVINGIKPNVMLEITKKSLSLVDKSDGVHIGEIKVLELLKKVYCEKYNDLDQHVMKHYRLFIDQTIVLLEKMNRKYKKIGKSFGRLKEFRTKVITLRIDKTKEFDEKNEDQEEMGDFEGSMKLNVKKIMKQAMKVKQHYLKESYQKTFDRALKVSLHQQNSRFSFVLKKEKKRGKARKKLLDKASDVTKEPLVIRPFSNSLTKRELECRSFSRTVPIQRPQKRLTIQSIDMGDTNRILERSRMHIMRSLIQRRFHFYP